MSTIKLKRIKQAVDTGVTQPLSIGGVASDNSDEVMSIASNGDLQFKKIIQTNGIKFPATQVPSADPNTLDDYEEGIFLPRLEGGTTLGTTTYGNRFGKYVKIGSVVFVDITIGTVSITGTGALYIFGLPFYGGNTGAMFDIALFAEEKVGALKGIVNGTSIELYLINNGSLANLPASDMSVELRLKMHYFVD